MASRSWASRGAATVTDQSTEDILREIDARFVSANSVPVERAMVKRVEWEAIKALLARLSMKVNAAACLLYGEQLRSERRGQ